MTAHRVKVVLGLGLISICIGGCEPGYIKRTERFADRVKSTVNPDELQAWATNLLAASPNADPRTPITVKEADIPQFIRAISTNQIPDVEIWEHLSFWRGQNQEARERRALTSAHCARKFPGT